MYVCMYIFMYVCVCIYKLHPQKKRKKIHTDGLHSYRCTLTWYKNDVTVGEGGS